MTETRHSRYGFQEWLYQNKFDYGGMPPNLDTKFEIWLQELCENHQEEKLWEYIEEYANDEYN